MGKRKIKWLEDRRIYNGLLIIILTTILFFIAIHRLETSKLNLKIGDIVQEDIRATKDLEDNIKTEKLKREVVNRVEPRYRINPSIQMDMKNKIKNFLDAARDIKIQENISLNRKTKLLEENQDLGLTSNEIAMTLRMDYKAMNKLENDLMDLINHLMGRGIKETELDYEKGNLQSTFESLNIGEEEKIIGLKLIESTIEANEFLDKEETERRKKEAAESIETVILKENEIIASQGTRISEHELYLVKESGLLKDDETIPVATILGLLILIILGVAVISFYIYYFNRDILYTNRGLILLIILVSTIIISKSLHPISPYIMPIATSALLISMLIDSKLALVINLFLTLYLSFIFKLDANGVAMYIMGGSIGLVLNTRHEQRYNILVNGIVIGMANTISLAAFGLAKGVGVLDALNGGGYGFLSGIISAIITLGTLPIWENIFHVLTPLKLLELSNPNQPLLKKLLLEAPGTYHHSILVGNLAEAAAESISADPLISRVGSYYHDIGKTLRPYYFAENQFGMENPHDKLQPMQSAEIILAHTTDGIALARKYKLPKEIIDIIDQHHGTTAVAYFYYKAKELNENMDIPIDEFRYKGKKPQTKEAAIVMMADSSEAAVRSIKNLTKDKIEDMIRKVVYGKIDDEQLEECDITHREVELMINSFVKVLAGIYHDRIEYPSIEK